MRRILSSGGAWLLATALAIAVAWLGVMPVRKAVNPDVTTLSASDARKLAPRNPSASPSPKPVSSPIGTVPAGFEQVPDGKGGSALQHTYEVDGGAATIQFEPGNVVVEATEPASGFKATFERSRDVTIVTFTSDQRWSRIEASWRDGPVATTSKGTS
ncbi:MAG: hypothetical protein QOJ50_1337 [Cryptosporangiaceae bacterium]|nr:hypothetical protein [Cryptosporangiaceae bacterium]